jgi:hypothetical protein
MSTVAGAVVSAGVADAASTVYPNASAYSATQSWGEVNTATCPSADLVTPALNTNLIENSGAEATSTMSGSAISEAYPDCWTSASVLSTGTNKTLASEPYTSWNSAESTTAVEPPSPGSRMFFGGNVNISGDSAYGFQTIPVSSLNAAGDKYELSGWLGGLTTTDDQASVTATFENSSGTSLGSTTIGPNTETSRDGLTGFKDEVATGTMPTTTATVLITINLEALHSGTYDDGIADNLYFGIGTSLQAVPTYGQTIAATSSTDCPSTVAVTPALNANLISNPGPASTVAMTPTAVGSEALPDCWTVNAPGPIAENGAVLNAISISAWESSTGYTITDPPTDTTNIFFGGQGVNIDGDSSYATQTINLSSLPSVVAGGEPFELTGNLGSYGTLADDASVTVTFEDGSGNALETATIGPVTEAMRGGTTELLYQESTGAVPAGTEQALVTLQSNNNHGGNWDEGIADDLGLYIGDQLLPLPAGVGVTYTPPSGNTCSLYNPTGVAAANGVVYVSNTKHNIVASVTTSNSATSILAGSCQGSGESGDNGLATSATLSQPAGLALDHNGDVFIADGGDNVVREIPASGAHSGDIIDFAGDGTAGDTGDGDQATSAELDDPQSVAVDASGDVFITDTDSNEIREVTPDGIIHDFAGNGTAGYYGDGGPATSAELNQPSGVAVDSVGDVYIADSANNVVREVAAGTGNISTVAGDYALDQSSNRGEGGKSGDGGPALVAQLDDPQGVALDPAGDLFIADTGNGSVREVTPVGTISTLYGGMNTPTAVGVDASTGTVYVADTSASEILIAGTGSTSPSGAGPQGSVVAPSLPESGTSVLLPIASALVFVGGGLFMARRRRRPGRPGALPA